MNEGPMLKCEGCKFFKENKCEKLKIDIIDNDTNYICPFILNSIKKINNKSLESFKNLLNNENIEYYKVSFDRYDNYIVYTINVERTSDYLLTKIKSILPNSSIHISGIGYNHIELSILLKSEEIKNYE